MVLPVVFAKVFKNMRVAVHHRAWWARPSASRVVFFLPYGPATWALLLHPARCSWRASCRSRRCCRRCLPSVKPEHYGVVGGIQATFQNFGMFLIASYVISPHRHRGDGRGRRRGVLPGGLRGHRRAVRGRGALAVPVPERALERCRQDRRRPGRHGRGRGRACGRPGRKTRSRPRTKGLVATAAPRMSRDGRAAGSRSRPSRAAVLHAAT